MRLASRVTILLGLPLLTQTVFTLLLYGQIQALDAVAKREVAAKKIISSCLDLRHMMFRFNVLYSYSTIIEDHALQKSTIQLATRMLHEADRLGTLIDNRNASRSEYREFLENLRQYLKVIKATSLFVPERMGHRQFVSSIYLHEREWFDDLIYYLARTQVAEAKIASNYAPIVAELQPEQAALKHQIGSLIFAGTLLSTVVVCILASQVVRNIILRLSLVLNNIDSFGALRVGEKLSGSDEFSIIDANFREISISVIQAAELRDAMFGMITHDLRSPLTSIKIGLELVEDTIPACKNEVVRIVKQVDRLGRLCTNLLDLQKLEQGRVELHLASHSAAKLADLSINAIHGLTVERKIVLLNKSAEEPLEFACDGDKLVQVLVNFLSNALKFSQEGSTVTLKSKRVGQESVRFEVQDQGRGIPPCERGRLFQRFSQLDQDPQTKKTGSGLGLYICRLLIESHGGSIGSLANETGGSIFWFEVPLETTQAHNNKKTISPVANRAKQRWFDQLRNQIWLLLLLPLVIQLCSVLTLGFGYYNLVSGSEAETRAKKILSNNQESSAMLWNCTGTFVARRFVGSESPVPTSAEDTSGIAERLKKIETEQLKLMANDPEALSFYKQYQQASDTILELWKAEIAQRVPTNPLLNNQPTLPSMHFPVTRLLFLAAAGEFDTIFLQLIKGAKFEQNIVKIYAPIADQLQPKEIAARQVLKNSAKVAAFVNFVFVLALAMVVARTIVQRLNILLKNLRITASENPLTLKGTDEFAQIDQKFREACARLNELDELKRSMYAMVSHDVRTPLTSIGLSLEMVSARYESELTPSAQERIGRLQAELRRLFRLANTFLDLERIESGKLNLTYAAVSVRTLVDQSVEAVRGLASAKKISIQVDVDELLESVCDSDRIIQVLVNLLSNAVKFSPPESNIFLSASADSGGIRFEVCDEGPGIPLNSQDLLFQKFSRLDHLNHGQETGSGLGLYICRILIEQHGGRIGIRKGMSGSIFWFSLPLSCATV